MRRRLKLMYYGKAYDLLKFAKENATNKGVQKLIDHAKKHTGSWDLGGYVISSYWFKNGETFYRYDVKYTYHEQAPITGLHIVQHHKVFNLINDDTLELGIERGMIRRSR